MINQKQIIRDRIAALKKSLSEEIITDLSRKICNRLVQTDLFQRAKCVALYYSIDNEVQTAELIEDFCSDKQIVLPVINDENIQYYPYTGKESLKKGAFGIAEPISCELITPEIIDVFIVPGVAFDYACNRLGRGRGYYDRYLSEIKNPIIGLCYDFQLVEHIPAESHDIKMTMVVAESSLLIRNL